MWVETWSVNDWKERVDVAPECVEISVLVAGGRLVKVEIP